jgi:nitrite reductase (NADH) small subunit
MKSPAQYSAGDADIPDGACRIVSVGEREVGVFNIGGRYYALPNRCPHQHGPLCAGVVSGTLSHEGSDRTPDSRLVPAWTHDGEVVACPWHGLEVHIPTGRIFAWPHRRVRTYVVEATSDGLVISI